jgi:hypothetical protein
VNEKYEVDLVDEDPIDLYLQEQALALSKVRARWNANRSILRPIVVALQKLKIETTLDSNLNVSISGDAKKLAAVVRIFMISGFKPSNSKPKQGDMSWHSYFHHPTCAIDIWFYFTSSVCKRVQVGTEMKEVPVYETQCDDITSEMLEETQPVGIVEFDDRDGIA